MSTDSSAHTTAAGAVRHFGRFQLLRLLGKSQRTMLWLASDPRNGREVMLAMPRRQLSDVHALSHWMQVARRGTRVEHPGLAPATEVGEHDRWPFIAYERGKLVTLAERLGDGALAAAELVPPVVTALQALAFAHEAGLVHGDLQPHLLAIAEPGRCRLLGLGLLDDPLPAGDAPARRAGAELDVLALGLVLHRGLSGLPALGEPDVGRVIARIEPNGREFVQLGRHEGYPIPDALRAIVQRATDRQPRRRYRSARTFERALAGWLQSSEESGGGPLAMLVDRIRSGGVLPALPGAASRAAQLGAMDDKRIDQLADLLLRDIGLAIELLRRVNGAAQRNALGGGNGAILTLRRALALLGLDGVRRAARALKPWPGSASDANAADLEQQMVLARQAGRAAQALRPPGYDAELVYLLAVLQRLGRLVVQYHFPEEAAQVRRLASGQVTGHGELDGEAAMSEQAASYAVLGVDMEAVGAALVQAWGFDGPSLGMMRRVALDSPVHASTRDSDMLRFTASCANELIDALALPSREQAHALNHIVQRYGRVLHIGVNDLVLAARGDGGEAREAAAADARAEAAAGAAS